MADYGTYANLQDIKDAIGLEDTTEHDARLLQCLETASREIDGPRGCRRHFYVKTATKLYSPVNSRRLLIDDDLLSVTTLKTDEDDDFDYDYTWATTDYFLLPSNSVPKTTIRVKPDGTYSFPTGIETVQIVGSWGYGDGQSATPYEDTGTNTNEALDASETGVDFVDGTVINAGMNLLIGSEQMYVTATSGNTGTVKRGVNGTTAATHDTNKDVYVYIYPPQIRDACILLAVKLFRLKDAPFGVIGSNEVGTVTAGRLFDTRINELLEPFMQPVVG